MHVVNFVPRAFLQVWVVSRPPVFEEESALGAIPYLKGKSALGTRLAFFSCFTCKSFALNLLLFSYRSMITNLAYTECCCSLAGFVYPIVTHWAWDENGWLYVGVEYTKDNVTMAVTYQVSCHSTCIS